MLKKISLAASLFMVIAGYLSCQSNSTGPDSSLEFAEFHTSNPPSLFSFLGIDLTGLRSYYLVDWTFLVDFSTKTKAAYQRLFARGFQAEQQGQNFSLTGVDMGQVSFAHIAGDTVQSSAMLGQIFSPAAGFTYSLLSLQGNSNPRFVPGDSLRFTRTGSATFDSLAIVLRAPSDSVAFVSPSFNNTINTNMDLRLTWRGGTSTDIILLTFQPYFETSGGMGFLSGTSEFLASNPGEFTLTQANLQAFLEHAEDELMQQGDSNAQLVGIFVYVALPKILELPDGNGRCVAMAFSSDQLLLSLGAASGF